MCEELDISVNELLSGVRLSRDNYEKRAEENMISIIKKNKRASKEERIICTILTIAIFEISIAGCVLGKLFTSDEALASIGIFYFIALICIVSAWIATTISLRNR